MVGRCGLSPWGLTWDHQPKPHQLDHPEKKTLFSRNCQLQISKHIVDANCSHHLSTIPANPLGSPLKETALAVPFIKMLSRVLFYFFWYLFLFLRCTFERSLQVSWCCLNCSSPGAHSSPAGRPGLPALFFILARKMEMFGKEPVRWFQCWKIRGWCWRSSSWSLGAEGECRPSLEWEKVNTDNVRGKGRGVLD